MPPEMTHNRFNVEEDLVRPLLKFLHQARLDLASRTAYARHRTTSESEEKGFLRDSRLRLQLNE